MIVADSGAGIPLGMKDSIFDKGMRTNTGHELFLVKEIPPLGKMTIRRSEGRRGQIPDQDTSGASTASPRME